MTDKKLKSNERIKEFKNLRIMNDKNKNRPGYKKTKIGWIPEDWDVRKEMDGYLKELGL